MPLGHDGQPLTDRFLKLLEVRKCKEMQLPIEDTKKAAGNDDLPSTTTTATTTHSDHETHPVDIEISENDVLMGHGCGFRSHKGNLLLEELLNASFSRYKHGSASSFEKTCVVRGIMQQINERGGRFLKVDKELVFGLSP